MLEDTPKYVEYIHIRRSRAKKIQTSSLNRNHRHDVAEEKFGLKMKAMTSKWEMGTLDLVPGFFSWYSRLLYLTKFRRKTG